MQPWGLPSPICHFGSSTKGIKGPRATQNQHECVIITLADHLFESPERNLQLPRLNLIFQGKPLSNFRIQH